MNDNLYQARPCKPNLQLLIPGHAIKSGVTFTTTNEEQLQEKSFIST